MNFLKQTPFLAACLLLFLQALPAQTLLPYLGKNGLTGLADESGTVVITPQFTKLDGVVGADMPMFFAYKDEVRMRVLRNGMMFPDSGGPTFFVANYNGDHTSLPDTIRHLIALDFSSKMVYVDTKTGKKTDDFNDARDIPSSFLYDQHRFFGSQKYAKAVYGAIRVGRGSKINFLDTTLNLLFSQDFTAGTVVDDTYFIVSKAEYQCAIADRSGKVRTGFDWDFLAGTPRKGFFIAGLRGKNPEKPASDECFGLIDANGKYLIKPVFKSIRAAGDHFLMVRDDSGEGIMDYAGKAVSPISEGALAYAFGNLFVRDPNLGKRYDSSKKATLINAKGESQLPFEVDQLKFVGESMTPQPHFQFSRGNISGVLSTDLKIIFQDTLAIEAIILDGKTCFITTDKGRIGSAGLKGLRDFSGREILPMAYEVIQDQYSAHLLKLKKDGKFGLATLEGQVVLPCRFEETHISMSAKGNTLYGMERNFYRAFDENGTRVPEKDCTHPMNRKEDFVYQPPTRRGQAKEVVFGDGNTVKTPVEWGQSVNLKGINSPVGILVIKENPGNYELYDTHLKALLPIGFRLPRNQFNPRLYYNVGMVPVWQLNPNSRWVEPPQEVPENPKVPASNDAPVQIAIADHDIRDIAMEENNGPDYIGCGVMDARGQWVIPPTKDARFEPVSWNLVVEYPLSGANSTTNSPRKLHRVNHPKPAIFDIFLTQGWDEGMDWGNCIVWQRQDNPEDPGKGQISRCTWFGHDGEQLAPFEFVMGPRHLKRFNVVSKMENGKKVGLIVNEKAQTIIDLNDLDEIPGSGYSGFTNGYVAAKKGGKWGVLDSVGKVAMPFRFEKLTILEGNRFLQEEIDATPKKWRLLSWNGALLEEADIPITIRESDSGYRFAVLNFRTIGESTNARTVIYAPDGSRVGAVDGSFISTSRTGGKERYGKFMTTARQYFWADLETGKAFMAP